MKILRNYLAIVAYTLLTICYPRENQLFWDGHDWNRILINSQNDQVYAFRIKTAYLHGVLDGRLNSYLKVWIKDQYLADDVFSETVDYLSNRELIKNIDFFYQERLNLYIPVPSAILIANMYAERVPINIIDDYINQTRRWINDLTIEMDTLNYSKLINDKVIKHQSKLLNQSE
jgi:hypothetical protein